MGRVLFSEFSRSTLGPARYAEPIYRYLDRTARPPFQRIRELLERWAGEYPALIDREWLGRFSSEDDRHHLGAFFELYSFALLDHQGLIPERAPVSENGTRPEFLVCHEGAPSFILECRLAGGSGLSGPNQKRINRVYDAINQLDSPNFFLQVQVHSAAANDPAGAALRHFLREKLTQSDPDALLALDIMTLPKWTWEDGSGWKVEFTPLPKKPEARGKPGVRPVGMLSAGGGAIDTVGPLQDALLKKASKYGNPSIPFVVALDALDPFVDDDSLAGALFGREEWVVNLRAWETKTRRQPNGLWVGRSGPSHRRVSAVLFARHLTPTTMAAYTPTLWHNPWANYPLDSDLWQGPQKVPDPTTNTVVLRAGLTAVEILGLGSEWPGWSDDEEED